MRRFITLLFILLATACTTKKSTSQNKTDTLSKFSIKKRKTDSLIAMGDRPDSEQEGNTFKEVLSEKLTSYNKIQNIDTLVVDEKDSMRVHCKFYCLHDSSLIVPKRYMWGGDKSRDFITHNFAVKIILITNRDTVLTKIFVKKDFTPELYDAIRKYATFIDFKFEGYNTKLKNKLLFESSISIPLTDVGVPVYLAIDKKGKYEILDQYAIKH
ncbi:DUF4738 domain-containing protein [Mucilaginibacter sp.]